MSGIPRQSIDEIVTKYELHPDLFDVFVEGDFDRDFIYEFLDAVGLRGDISVYAIDAIEVPPEEVLSAGLGHGSNKSRVLALAWVLRKKLSKVRPNIVCIVDADLDRLFGRLRDWTYVHHTDYTCMEMYSLNLTTLRKFLQFSCTLGENAASEFFALASNILPVQFFLRGTIEQLNLGVPVPPFATGLKRKRHLDSFDRERYVENFFGRSPSASGSRRSQLPFSRLWPSQVRMFGIWRMATI